MSDDDESYEANLPGGPAGLRKKPVADSPLRSYHGGTLTVRDAAPADLARWPGCDRVASDHNTSTPLYPQDDEAEVAAEWLRSVGGSPEGRTREKRD